MPAEPTWIVLTRDVSHAVRVNGESCVIASLVLDVETGFAQGIAVAPTLAGACAEAMRIALTKPAGPLPPRAPAQVLCGAGQVVEVAGELAKLLDGLGGLDGNVPKVAEIAADSDAEDVFDSLVGHLAGRQQPEELPDSGDWRMLVGHADEFRLAQPWLRWADDVDLDLIVRVAGAPMRYVAVVIGQEGFQRGLVLYPGGVLPDGLRSVAPKKEVAVPQGTLLLFLDPPAEVPREFRAKAIRYGWPADADLFPSWVMGGPAGASDLDQRDARRLTLAMAAVLAHDRRRIAGEAGKSTGELAFDGDPSASYTIG